MAEGSHPGRRTVKPRIDPDFIYDQGSIQFLHRRESRSDQHSQDSASSKVDSGKECSDNVFWSDIRFPLLDNSDNSIRKVIHHLPISGDNFHSSGSSFSLVPSPANRREEELSVLVDEVNKCSERRNSSTRYNYLDTYYLSVSPGENTNSSDMGLSDNEGNILSNANGAKESNIQGGNQGSGILPRVKDITRDDSEELGGGSGMNSLLDRITALETLIHSQNAAIGQQLHLIGRQNRRLATLENAIIASSNESENESISNSSHKSKKSSKESLHKKSSHEKKSGREKKSSHKSNSSHKPNSSQKSKPSQKPVSSQKSKSSRVEEERARSLKVLRGQLSGNSSTSSESSSDETDEDLNAKGIKKRMSKKQKDLCDRRMAANLRKIGSTFPEDDFDTSESSGKESGDTGSSCRHRKKVKSGAKIKQRPVVRTELWPHTLAIEEDGVEVDSETIGLVMFNEYFAHIASTCKSRTESRGRAALLRAISRVTGSLQWADARTFHNVIMVKIEQGRLEWDDDFLSHADSFIERKLRSAKKVKQVSSGTGSARSGAYGRGYNNSRNQNQRFGNRGKPLYGAICWQWNSGTCSFGDNCKRWHCCKTCAEAGRLGENHKASSHDSNSSRSSSRPSQPV